MKYSVIVPAYNCGDSIGKTVDSILSSGLRDFELIVIDDGSRDGTGAVCDALAQKHEALRCIHQKNGGVSAARNRGIDEARGEYLLFFDADDSVDENALCRVCELAEKNAPDMLLFGESFDYYLHGRLYRRDETVCPEEAMLARAEWKERLAELYDCNALSPVWNKLIKREIITDNGVRFDGSVFEMEDFLFSVECLKHCESVYMLPEAIYRYRQAEDERGTYNRLCRVDSLTDYMRPFERSLAELEKGGTLVGRIYAMLFHEQLRFADIGRIKKAAADMLRGRYAEVIKADDPKLYAELQNGRYGRVYRQRLKARLRHFAAVRYKYYRSLLKK